MNSSKVESYNMFDALTIVSIILFIAAIFQGMGK